MGTSGLKRIYTTILLVYLILLYDDVGKDLPIMSDDGGTCVVCGRLGGEYRE